MTNYTYTADIPDAPNNPSNDQGPMKTNTNSINSIIGEDHYSFNDNLGGQHKWVRMPLSGGGSGTIPPALTASEGTIYTKTDTTPASASQLFYSPDASGNEYQLTKSIAASFATFSTNTAYAANHTGGWTFLPGGMLLQYGLRSSASSSGSVTFPVTFPSGVAPYSITTGAVGAANTGNVSISTSAPSSTGFSFNAGLGLNRFYWVAIGK